MKNPIDYKDFLKVFEEKVYTPIERKFKQNVTHPMKDEVLKVLKTELPHVLFGWITKEETFANKSGALKYLGVLGKLVTFLDSKGLGSFVPMLVPIVEFCVRWIYQHTVESIVDKLGLEDNLEAWLGFDVDSGKSTTSTKATKATSAEPAPKPAG